MNFDLVLPELKRKARVITGSADVDEEVEVMSESGFSNGGYSDSDSEDEEIRLLDFFDIEEAAEEEAQVPHAAQVLSHSFARVAFFANIN